MTTRRAVLGAAAGTLTLAALGAGTNAQASAPSVPSPAARPPSTRPVSRWARRHAVPIHDPCRPGADLAAIAGATARAQVIGLGEPGHRLGEVTALQARYLEHLVTRAGVRAVAFEMDWTLCLAVNDYVLGRRDDIDTVMGTLESIWRTREVREVLRWLRRYNDRHRRDVQVAGTEYFATGLVAYEAVETYVAAHAPDRLAELDAHFTWLKPPCDDIGKHLGFYAPLDDKTDYLAAAAGLMDLIASVGGGEGYDVVAHHARQIHSWYEGFSLPWDDIPHYRDARAAENIRWWQQHTDARTLYWAASSHVADAPHLTITDPGGDDTVLASAGSYLSDWYGRRYVAIGFTFDHGTYQADDGTTVELPPAPHGWFEQPLAEVRDARFVLRLDRPAPAAVADWLDAPLVTRGRPQHGEESIAYGGTLREWFDVLVHTQEVSPAHPL